MADARDLIDALHDRAHGDLVPRVAQVVVAERRHELGVLVVGDVVDSQREAVDDPMAELLEPEARRKPAPAEVAQLRAPARAHERGVRAAEEQHGRGGHQARRKEDEQERVEQQLEQQVERVQQHIGLELAHALGRAHRPVA